MLKWEKAPDKSRNSGVSAGWGSRVYNHTRAAIGQVFSLVATSMI